MLTAAAIAALVLVAGVATVLVRANTTKSAASGCALPHTAPGASATAANAAPEGGGVTATETAFSPTEGDDGVSMAAILRNSSRASVAYRTTVTFAMSTPAGQNALYPEAAPDMVIVIPVLLPGESIGVANWAGLRPDAAGTPAAAGS